MRKFYYSHEISSHEIPRNLLNQIHERALYSGKYKKMVKFIIVFESWFHYWKEEKNFCQSL